MNATTLKSITKHGQALLAVFPAAKIKDPVKLYKQLRRAEVRMSELSVKNCNENLPQDAMDGATAQVLQRVMKLLGICDATARVCGLEVNHDPRGYAFTFGLEWTEKANSELRQSGLCIQQDLGNYGIIAPDFTDTK